MKKFVLAGAVSLLITASVAVAQQSQNQHDSSSTRGMMHGMMDQKGHGAGAGHMGGTMNMMNMMAQMDQEQMSKMMEQCGAMMESARTDGGGAKESQKQ